MYEGEKRKVGLLCLCGKHLNKTHTYSLSECSVINAFAFSVEQFVILQDANGASKTYSSIQTFKAADPQNILEKH